MNIEYSDLRRHFLKAEPRPQQKRAMYEICSALKSDKKIIILEAPTGFGKSDVAMALAGYLNSAWILTSQKILQEQYRRDFKDKLLQITGRSNWKCVDDERLTCAVGKCTVEQPCKYKPIIDQYDLIEGVQVQYKLIKDIAHIEKKVKYSRDRDDDYDEEEFDSAGSNETSPCLYYDQKYRGLVADKTVVNYPYFFILSKYTHETAPRELLVMDEAHDLEKQMTDFTGVNFNQRDIREVFKTINHSQADTFTFNDFGMTLGRKHDLDAWMSTLELLNTRIAEVINTISEKSGKQVGINIVLALQELLKKLTDTQKKIKHDRDNWLVSESREDKGQILSVELKPLDLSKYFEAIFEKGNIKLCMSATILDHVAFCKAVGLSTDEVVFLREDSDFPPENRPIYPMNAALLNTRTINMPEVQENIAYTIDKIMTRHKNEKGIIHTTSYSQITFIQKILSPDNNKRLLATAPNSVAKDVLRMHERSAEPSVLISPSLYQGIDLTDDLSRWQIIVKIPYPNLGDRWIARKAEKSQQWYQWQTMLRLIQAYGRSVRSKDDHARTYILDAQFGKILRTHKHMMPSWFTEAVSKELPTF